MTTIKAILVDDEKNALEVLEWLIKTYCPEVEIVGQFQSGEDCLNNIQSLKPDVLFLDVEMPKMNGFDLLEKIQDKNFDVVFTTAYDKFAVKAFRYSAINYLLKPIDPDDLITTVERIKQKKAVINKEQVDLLFQSLVNKDNTLERIALSTNDGLTFVMTKEIIYCKAESNYTSLALLNGKKILIAKTLKEIDETLAGKDFFRVHKSFLVNINHISKFVRGEGGYIVMPDSQQISIARDRKDDFFQLFTKF